MQWFCDFACPRNEPKFSRKLPFCFESVHEDSQKCRNTAFPPSGNNLRVLTRPILAQPDLHLCNRCCLHSHSCNLHTKSMLHTSYVKLLQSHIKLPSDDHRYRVFLVPSDAISSNQHIHMANWVSCVRIAINYINSQMWRNLDQVQDDIIFHEPRNVGIWFVPPRGYNRRTDKTYVPSCMKFIKWPAYLDIGNDFRTFWSLCACAHPMKSQTFESFFVNSGPRRVCCWPLIGTMFFITFRMRCLHTSPWWLVQERSHIPPENINIDSCKYQNKSKHIRK